MHLRELTLPAPVPAPRFSLSPQFLPRLTYLLARALLALALLLAVTLSALSVNFSGQHWAMMFRPAALTFAAGASPYTPTSPFFNPPWVLIPLVPLAWLPAIVGQVALALACAVSLYVAARRLGASRLVSAIVLLLPQTVFMYRYVNLDWLAPLGLFMPVSLGLFFALAKPQLGLGLALYWLAWTFRRRGLVGVALTFGPLALALLLSLAVYGNWLTATNPGRIVAADWSLTFWPWTVPLGLLLIAAAIRRRWPGLALFGGALLSPYMAYYSWTIAAIGLLGTPRRALVVLAILAAIGLHYN